MTIPDFVETQNIASLRDVIHTGDAREWVKTLPDGCADVLLWDPDYGVEGAYTVDGRMGRVEALAFVEELLPELRRVTRSGQAVMFWSGSIGRVWDLLESKVDSIWPIHYLGIWHKTNSAPASGDGLSRGFEPWFWLKDGPRQRGEWEFLPDVLSAPRVVGGFKEAAGHPAQKPVKILEQLIRFFTQPGQIVLDPTAGSGSTAVAAKRTGRHYLCCEIIPEYAEIARRRVARTGTQPQLLRVDGTQTGLFDGERDG